MGRQVRGPSEVGRRGGKPRTLYVPDASKETFLFQKEPGLFHKEMCFFPFLFCFGFFLHKNGPLSSSCCSLLLVQEEPHFLGL